MTWVAYVDDDGAWTGQLVEPGATIRLAKLMSYSKGLTLDTADGKFVILDVEVGYTGQDFVRNTRTISYRLDGPVGPPSDRAQEVLRAPSPARQIRDALVAIADGYERSEA